MTSPMPRFCEWKPSFDHIDSGFSAGAALCHLHAFWTSNVLFHGALAERLAIKAAASTLRASGRPEDEDAVRDQWWFRQPAGALSPAASVFRAWLMLTSLRRGWRSLSVNKLLEIAGCLGPGLHHSPEATLEAVDRKVRGSTNPLKGAVAASVACFEIEQNEALAHLVADAVLADQSGWEIPLPLLASHIALPALRAGGTRRRALPSDASWSGSALGAYAMSVETVMSVAQGLDRGACRLLAFAPKLRSKAAERGIEAILSHACLAASPPVAGMSDRGMRRLFDRLVEAGALRELTGRPIFRLYGL